MSALAGAAAVVGTANTASATSTGDLAMGGGKRYDDIVARRDASTVVRTTDGLSEALADATAGDVVFVAGDATLDIGRTRFDVPAGVTVASNRGRGPGALVTTDEEPETVFRLAGAEARITGLRLRGPFPDSDVTHKDGIPFENELCAGVSLAGANCEVDNNDIAGFVHSGVFVDHGGDGGQHVHHNYIHQNNTQGLGYGVSVGRGENLRPTIEYNYFDENRHSVAASGENHGYVCRFNHFGPTHVMHVIDVHDPGARDTVIERNVVESLVRTWDDNCCPTIGGFDETRGTIRISDNWFWNDACAYDVPVNGDDIVAVDNVHGSDASVALTDVIPNHPGFDDRPWA